MVSRYIRSNVLGFIAIFIALGGVGYAAGVKKNSVGTKQLKNGQVMTRDLADNAVNGAKVADGTLTGADVNEATFDPAILQARVGVGCDPGASIRGIAADGTVTCETDDSGGASGAAGGDLTGTYPDPTIADGAVTSAKVNDDSLTGTDILESSLDSTILQSRIGTPCAANSAIRAIAANGAVTCETSIPGPPTGSAAGDLNGSYPNPSLASGAVQSGEIQDGATLSEIADDDGSGSGLDADLLDGKNSTQLDATCPANYPVFVANLCFEDPDSNGWTLPAAVDHCRGLAPGGRLPLYTELLALIQSGLVSQANIFLDWTASSAGDNQSIYINNSNDPIDADGVRPNTTASYVRCVVQPVEAP
jgi:hypothetical protein